LNIFDIFSFSKVSIVSLLSFLSAEAADDILLVLVLVFVWLVKVPLFGELGVDVEQSDEEVNVKTCKSFSKIFSNGIWVKIEESFVLLESSASG
jgi:hypothetical protein